MRAARPFHTTSSMSPFSVTALRAWSRRSSSLQSDEATPTTGTPLLAPETSIAYTAGKIFLWARSPVAPKRTRASLLGAPFPLMSSCLPAL